jgi:hypothetical protein
VRGRTDGRRPSAPAGDAHLVGRALLTNKLEVNVARFVRWRRVGEETTRSAEVIVRRRDVCERAEHGAAGDHDIEVFADLKERVGDIH